MHIASVAAGTRQHSIRLLTKLSAEERPLDSDPSHSLL
jgi:hypothetical protein